jgi:tetratricopeptide (TPR) repeat protein
MTNVLLHLANVLLVFKLFSQMTGRAGRSAFVAALFAVHPLHVESVAWITERKDVLSTLFALLSLLAYAESVHARRRGLLVPAWIFFVASLLSKQTFVTLPLVLLLLDYWPLERLNFERRPAELDGIGNVHARSTKSNWLWIVLEKLPFVAASGVFCLVALSAQRHSEFVQSFQNIPFTTRCLNAILVYGLYLWKFLIPVNLSSFYPHPGSRLSLSSVAGSGVVLSAISCCAIVNARRRPFLLVGWLWYLVSLLPMIGLIQVGRQQMADRYVYFPLLGIYAAIAWTVPTLMPASMSGRRFLPILATGIVGTFAAIAFVQVGYWRDSVTLYRHSLAAAEDNAQARIRLGTALLVRGEREEAMTHLQKAVELEPKNSQAHFALGGWFLALSRWKEAAGQFRAAIACDESFPAAHGNLGFVLFKQRDYAAARRELDRALEIN